MKCLLLVAVVGTASWFDAVEKPAPKPTPKPAVKASAEALAEPEPADPTVAAYAPAWCAACPKWKTKLGDAVDWKKEEFKGAAFYPCFVANGKPLVVKVEEYEALLKLPAEDVMAVLKRRAGK